MASLNRILIDGSIVPELEEPITLKVVTKCPQKWKLIDMETGQSYTGTVPVHEDDLHWQRDTK